MFYLIREHRNSFLQSTAQVLLSVLTTSFETPYKTGTQSPIATEHLNTKDTLEETSDTIILSNFQPLSVSLSIIYMN